MLISPLASLLQTILQLITPHTSLQVRLKFDSSCAYEEIRSRVIVRPIFQRGRCIFLWWHCRSFRPLRILCEDFNLLHYFIFLRRLRRQILYFVQHFGSNLLTSASTLLCVKSLLSVWLLLASVFQLKSERVTGDATCCTNWLHWLDWFVSVSANMA